MPGLSGSTASCALICFLTREPPHSTQWTMVKINRVNLMFMISFSAVFLANWVPEFLKGWDILDRIAGFGGAHRMSSIINAQGKAKRTAGALLIVGELYYVKGNGKLYCSVLVLSNLIYVVIFILFCLHS